jgi:hypothetical protein
VATSKFAVRDAKELDFPFIYSTWLKGLRFGNDVYGLIEQNSYFTNFHKVIEAILARPDTFIMVACLKDDPDTILGYSVRGADDTLHYVHVKQAFRRFGIARELTPTKIKRVTHITRAGWAILKEKYPKAVFDPFLN